MTVNYTTTKEFMFLLLISFDKLEISWKGFLYEFDLYEIGQIIILNRLENNKVQLCVLDIYITYITL